MQTSTVRSDVEGGWLVRVPGQPPSRNHLYKDATRPATDKYGQRLYWPDGRAKTYRTKVKSDGVQTYQDSVTWYTRSARPSDWRPGERLRLRYWFHLKRDIDCDNALKVIDDAVAHALGTSDRSFLPTVEAKWTGEREPFVVIEIANEVPRPHQDAHHATDLSGIALAEL